MKTEIVERILGVASFSEFREVARECLAARRYGLVGNSDGWNDGGSDLRLFVSGVDPAQIAIQISIVKEWKTKIKTDAKKAKDQLNITHFIYVSNRRIPDTEFLKLEDELRASLGIHISKVDLQVLASILIEYQLLPTLFKLLDLPAVSSSVLAYEPKTELKYSYILFDREPANLKNEIIEQAIISFINQNNNNVDRETTINQVISICGLDETSSVLINSRFDRLLTDRKVSISATQKCFLKEGIRKEQEESKLLFETELGLLNEKIDSVLVGAGVKKNVVVNTRDIVIKKLSALFLFEQKTQLDLITGSYDTSSSYSELNSNIIDLKDFLRTVGVTDESKQNDLIKEILAAKESTILKKLAVGELFIKLIHVGKSEIIAALGGKSSATVVLDSSVAIPFLCCSKYSAVHDSHFSNAFFAVKNAEKIGLTLVIPRDYVEETASHLLDAPHYLEILRLDESLELSQNAFISYYSSLRKQGINIDLMEFLQGIGLKNWMLSSDFRVARDELIPALIREFGHYNISPASRPTSITQRNLQKAQEDISYAHDEIKEQRPTILVEHDINTLLYLRFSPENNHRAVLMCTWDRTFFIVRKQNDDYWWCMDPANLAELIGFCQKEKEFSDLSLSSVLYSLSSKTVALGSKIWDELVRIEKGRMMDAEIVKKAKTFKEQYMLDLTGDKFHYKIFEEKWEEFKKLESIS